MDSASRAFGFLLVLLFAGGAVLLFALTGASTQTGLRFDDSVSGMTENGKRVGRGETVIVDENRKAPVEDDSLRGLILEPGAPIPMDEVSLEMLRLRAETVDNEEVLRVEVRPDDTWRALAWRYLRSDRDWRALRRFNHRQWRGEFPLSDRTEAFIPIALQRY